MTSLPNLHNFQYTAERFTVTIYRVIQESLSNIVKHSQARYASVEFCCQPNLLTIKITDDGVGFSVNQMMEKSSLGIFGMRERIALLGGDFTILSEPGKGTTVYVEIPIVSPGTVLHLDQTQREMLA